jgi:hypothetical protein
MAPCSIRARGRASVSCSCRFYLAIAIRDAGGVLRCTGWGRFRATIARYAGTKLHLN